VVGPDVAVGAVVLDRGRVLLIQRGNPPLAGTWTLPGGRVARGESLTDALRREVLEETALTIEVGPLVEVVEIVDARWHYVILDYVGTLRSDASELRAGDDAADARFVLFDELERYGITPAVARVIAAARGLVKT
jgi:8-oxo-dGTP diphosphatase